MFNNIAFIGGIHGVGKSTISKAIVDELSLTHLSASEVLKWKEINADEKNKKVKDVFETQNRLITGLQYIIVPSSYYLLDGHFILLDKDGNLNQVPFQTFRDISPILIAVVICDVSVIMKRLGERDSKTYDYNTLNEMQKAEVAYAKEVAAKLRIPYIESSTSDYKNIISILKPLMK